MQHDTETGGFNLGSIDRLIHEPARYNIMALLYVIEKADFLFIQNQTEMTSGNLSTHLRKLEEGGYVEIEKQFIGRKPRTFVRLSKTGRKCFENYREEMKKMFADDPDKIKSDM
jgi:DNA-binding MarR family transcriptional regulator